MKSQTQKLAPTSLIVAYWAAAISVVASIIIMVLLYAVASSAAEVPMFISVIAMNLSALIALVAAIVAAVQYSGPVRTHAVVLIAAIVLGRIILGVGGAIDSAGVLAALQVLSIVLLLGAVVYLSSGLKKGIAAA
ncbi:hypothetical protein CCICO_02555 [Corynebacterium ciconiae DSM 44920]|uniref:hypothetical protein n=1 Tax=Corynebacterium ciconiae TaxID=227319 RepID=UPI000365DE24|nr:hypothetical protein [Corynebacterium ciconiae]WKD60561.1 hypothetical protein CCICO_02555 [Corynebacterium ciconiae DSM 44920]